MPEVLRYHPINFIQISPARVNRVSVLWCSKGVIFISHCNLEAFKIRKMQRFYTRVSKGLKGGLQGRFLMLSLHCLAALLLWNDSFSIPFTGNKSTKIKAKQMAECDAELSAVLFSRQEKIAKDDQPVRETDAIRKRLAEF